MYLICMWYVFDGIWYVSDTYLICIWYVFEMCLKCVWNVFEMCLKCSWPNSQGLNMYVCMYWNAQGNDMYPQTKEIRLEIITTANILTSFHRSPRNSQTSFHGNPKKFKHLFTGVNRSPCHSKEWPGKPANLEIQIF